MGGAPAFQGKTSLPASYSVVLWICYTIMHTQDQTSQGRENRFPVANKSGFWNFVTGTGSAHFGSEKRKVKVMIPCLYNTLPLGLTWTLPELAVGDKWWR